MQEDKQFYDNFFTNYPVSIHDNPARFRAVADLLFGNVLDVACGTGTLSKYYPGNYTGVDISDIAILKAKRERRKDAKFFTADFAKDAFVLTEKFDSAYLGEFLEHIQDDKIVFDNVLELVKPNGRIVVSVPNGDRVPDDSHCRTFTVASIRRDYSKYGKIIFHNWEGFHDRILFSIQLGIPDKSEVALVMIAKDEAKGIEKSIISALPFVDRVIVSVDEGTTDTTREVAEMYADEVKTHKWENDFSKARNEAHAGVKSRWILFLDGHEYIESFGNIREKLKNDVDGIFVTIRMETGMTFLYPRFYRNGLQFKNAVHNLVECQTKRAEPAFVIVHDRLNLQEEKAAERRNKQREEMMPIELKKQLAENPKNARAHFHLANFYLMSNDEDLSLFHYKKTIKYGKFKDEKYLALLHYGSLHLARGHSFRALWIFNRADRLLPGRWESARVLGGFYFLQKHYKKAVEFLVQALGKNSRRYAYQPMEQNLPDIWDKIGHCFVHLDEPEKGLIAYRRGLELAKTPAQKSLFNQKIQLVKTLVDSALKGKDGKP
jgi:SAM-dependent methyltransferase